MSTTPEPDPWGHWQSEAYAERELRYRAVYAAALRLSGIPPLAGHALVEEARQVEAYLRGEG